jgi:phosphoribosylamine--glycine ligase
MNVLLIGSGGREHAFAWKLSQSPLLSNLLIAPGNPGTSLFGTNINVNPTDFQSIKREVLANKVNLVVVGPEDPLVKGIHDFFLADSELKNIPVIGPTKAGAMLEGSKDFSKQFMVKHGIPTAAYQSFKPHHREKAIAFLKTLEPPYVIKADGLAAGKGVVISSNLDETISVVDEFFAGKFGEASKTIVIEEFLKGIELSVFVLTDGQSYVILPEAKDYKRIGDGDTGPNTGGMGAISPVPFATPEFMQKVEERIIKLTINGLKAERIDYVGFIFIGLMNVAGEPFVIEYNARMGDPETQVVLPRLKTDFLKLLQLASQKRLQDIQVEFYSTWAAAVILASGGYPNDFEKGLEINMPQPTKNSLLFHAGTSKHKTIVTSGGRVFASVGLGSTLVDALNMAYKMARAVDYKDKYYRNDIGKDLLTYFLLKE